MDKEALEKLYNSSIGLGYERFLSGFSDAHDISPAAIFVVSSPRTGSTFIYQQLINMLGGCYVSNFTNDFFAKTPAMGMYLERQHPEFGAVVQYRSEYGKTRGLFETSEASAVFAQWFGGTHPSEIESANFKSDAARNNMVESIRAFNQITGQCFITKNPWNSFRIRAIREALPNAHFVWIRRSIDRAALSDLENRYQRGDPAEVWNSATTKDYLEIKNRPYWEQVVLQQQSYTRSIGASLQDIGSGYSEVWYEDLCENPAKIMRLISDSIRESGGNISEPGTDNEAGVSVNKAITKDYEADYRKIMDFVWSNPDIVSLMYQRG